VIGFDGLLLEIVRRRARPLATSILAGKILANKTASVKSPYAFALGNLAFATA